LCLRIKGTVDLSLFINNERYSGLLEFESSYLQKHQIFFTVDENLKAQSTPKTKKQARFSHIRCPLETLAWTISEPHISTYENLHAKQKPISSRYLRGFLPIFGNFGNFGDLLKKERFKFFTTTSVPIFC
jgi:hypothetical protein